MFLALRGGYRVGARVTFSQQQEKVTRAPTHCEMLSAGNLSVRNLFGWN